MSIVSPSGFQVRPRRSTGTSGSSVDARTRTHPPTGWRIQSVQMAPAALQAIHDLLLNFEQAGLLQPGAEVSVKDPIRVKVEATLAVRDTRSAERRPIYGAFIRLGDELDIFIDLRLVWPDAE